MTKKKVEIVVDPGNARVHDERNQQVIQESLRELGAGRSIVIDKAGQVIAGNETYRQAKALGLPVKIVESDGETLIVVQRKDLAPEDERRRALAIADNRSSDLSEFDMGILANTLKAAGPELRDAMGFTEKELAQVFRQAQPKELKDPPAPAVPEEPRAKPGQLFILGPHRLLCGDATKKKDVNRLMAGKKATVVLTDPPYGINVVSRNKIGGDKPATFAKVGYSNKVEANYYRPIIGDDKAFEPQFLFDLADDLIIFGANYFADKLPASPGWMVWDKNAGREWADTFADCELIYTTFDKHAQIYRCLWKGMVKEGEHGKRMHPTQKPVKLIGALITDFVEPLGLVLDPFLGSGTTLIAADQLERVCYGLEIDPGYCDVIIRRYAEFKEIDIEGIYATANVG